MKPATRALVDDNTPGVIRRSSFKDARTWRQCGDGDDRGVRGGRRANFVQTNVKRASEPSALKITDLRVAVVAGAPMTCPLIRIDTNQGLVGLGRGARRRQRDATR